VAEAIAAIRADVPTAKLEALALDLSKADAAMATTKRFPDADILVNNLGVYELKPFEQITDADWLAIIETNFLSGVRLSRHYLPRMKSANWGRIIFISSESAANIPVEMIHYGVTKTMQVALARGLAETTAGTGVTVNSILAGPTRSEGVDKFVADIAKSKNTTVEAIEKDFFRTARPGSLLQRFATTDEVAAMVAFIASPRSSATNGAALRVEGGVLRSIL
jgi:NAD(P)-dependent dehydrogenase (short-subunit alcohol dehydrogenase family)